MSEEYLDKKIDGFCDNADFENWHTIAIEGIKLFCYTLIVCAKIIRGRS